MAVLALGFLGEAIGAEIGGTLLGVTAASIGGFIGSSIGSMVDNMLFPVKQQGPRLTDLSVQTAAYGAAIPILYGPENRLAGNVLWNSGLIETQHTQHSGKGGPSVDTTTWTYSVSFAVGISDCAKRGPIASIKKIWANKKLIYDATGASTPDSAGLWSSIAIYDGSFTQLPDPTIESYKGVGNVSGFVGTSYVVFTGFQLADYGNRIPSIEFLCEQDDLISAAEVLSSIAEICGMDPRTVGTSSIVGNVRGYAIGNQSSGTGTLQPLALVYNFDAAQIGGSLRFCPRGNGPAATVPTDWLSGHQAGEQRPNPIQWSRSQETLLPREASLTFPDPARDYQQNSQVSRRQAGSAQSNLNSTIAIVVDVETGRQLADRMLWEAWTGRTTALVQTDDRLRYLDPGRCYAFETPAGLEPLRVKTKTRGVNGVIELELTRDRAEVYHSTAAGTAAPAPPQTVNVPGPSDLFLIDSPIMQDADDDTGFYFAVDGIGTGWRGCDVIRSTDTGVTFDEVEPVGIQTTKGIADLFAAGPTEVFDHATVLRVVLDDPSDQLESVTEPDVLNGKNACWIGPANGRDGEIAQFTTADLISAGVYDLSGWLRGRLGTEHAVDGHGSGEIFVLLDTGPLRRTDYSPADWNKERIYKAVSLLTLEADADAVTFTNTGEGKRPLSPVHISGETDSVTGDTEVTWTRRSRLRQPGLGNGSVPLGESVEAYELDVIVAGDVVRTLTSSTPSALYTAAMRAADGGGAKEIAVYQISDVRGRGRPGNAEI